MTAIYNNLIGLILGDRQRDRVVPPTGYTASLTTFTSAAMAFLAVFAIALSLAASRLSDHWSESLARSSTLRISAPAPQIQQQLDLAMEILDTTPGIASARVISLEEQRSLLEPWFGPEVPFESLPLPKLIDIEENSSGYDGQSLRLRLIADVPGAVLDDHTRWRRPLVTAAHRLWALGMFSIVLMAATSAAIITLAARAAMSANAQVISVLRLIGAQDNYISAAFVRRFTFRAFNGASLGGAFGAVVVYFFQGQTDQLSILTGLGFQGTEWLWLIIVPPLMGIVAYIATRRSAGLVLRGLS
ncbi:MAG: cell division protein FtsX [Paracoccaceae bacterium]|nr:cell division protein FtsX [Paracoccaceae bacterium]